MALTAVVIGCGRIASGFDDDPKRKMIATHIGAYQHVKGVDVIAVCDTNEALMMTVKQKRGIKHGYTDYRRMLNELKPDIVSICTPPQTHAALVIDIARRGLAKAIFCEKPIAQSINEAKRMIKACDQAGIILQIDHQRRFDQMHQRVKSMLEQRKWGEIQRVNFYYTAGISNTGSHMFDLLRFFFGDVQWIQAFDSHNPSHNPKDPNLDGTLKFQRGFMGSFQAFDHQQYLLFEMDIFMTKGRLILKQSGFNATISVVGDHPIFSGYKDLVQDKLPFEVDYQRSFMVNAVKEILNCVNNQRQSVSSGNDGLRAMELIELSLKSAAHQGRIYQTSVKRG